MQLQFKTGLKAALQVQMDLLEQDPVFSPSSSLPVENMENFLEKKEKSINEKNESSSKTVNSFEEGMANQKADLADSFKVGEKELHSLKESLKSLDKSFS